MPDQACPTCNGARIIPSPNGQYQECPSCDGAGTDPGVELLFVYIFDVVMTALQRLNNQRVVVDGDAEFVWKAFTSRQNNPYRIRFSSGAGTYISSGGGGATNDLVRSENIAGTAEFPFPIIPHVIIPRAGNILFDIEELGGGANTIQLAFIGAKRYPTPR
jgi:hypothetical protein